LKEQIVRELNKYPSMATAHIPTVIPEQIGLNQIWRFSNQKTKLAFLDAARIILSKIHPKI